jgi:hypothetical protein
MTTITPRLILRNALMGFGLGLLVVVSTGLFGASHLETPASPSNR